MDNRCERNQQPQQQPQQFYQQPQQPQHFQQPQPQQFYQQQQQPQPQHFQQPQQQPQQFYQQQQQPQHFQQPQPAVENVKHTINNRLQDFMFRPYLNNKANGIMSVSPRHFGKSSKYCNEEHVSYANTMYSMNNSNDAFGIPNNQNIYKSLERNLSVTHNQLQSNPLFEQRPKDTRQDYF